MIDHISVGSDLGADHFSKNLVVLSRHDLDTEHSIKSGGHGPAI
jgi:hypothetical protein